MGTPNFGTPKEKKEEHETRGIDWSVIQGSNEVLQEIKVGNKRHGDGTRIEMKSVKL